nr:unnamed protein product [Naegleria fowleri]
MFRRPVGDRRPTSTAAKEVENETHDHPTTSPSSMLQNNNNNNNSGSEIPTPRSETPSSHERTRESSSDATTTSPLTPNSQNRILTKLPSSLKLDTQKLIRKTSLSSFSSLSKSLRSSMNPYMASDSKHVATTTTSSSGQKNVPSHLHPHNIMIIEIGRKYFKCGLAMEYAPRVISVVPSELSELLCMGKNQKFNSLHMKESFEKFIQKDLAFSILKRNDDDSTQNSNDDMSSLTNSMIFKDEIFEEYMKLSENSPSNIHHLDDAEFERKLSTLFSQYMNKLFIDEMKLVMDSIDGIIILENTNQLHQHLLRKIIENDICTVRKFPRLKSLKFMNSQGCAVLPSFCSMYASSNNQKTNQTRTFDSKLFGLERLFMKEQVPTLQKSVGNTTIDLRFQHAPRGALPKSDASQSHDFGITALIIDCGYSECRIVPVLFGSILPLSVEILSIGSKNVLRNLEKQLFGSNEGSAYKLLDSQEKHEILEDILSRMCFCSNDDINSSQTIMYKYNLSSKKMEIPLTHHVRSKSCEFMFEPLTSAIIDCLKRLETEARGKILRNIIVCGGLSELNGFKKRLISTLHKHLSEQKFGSSKNWLKYMGINTFNPTRSSLLNWYGASIAFSSITHYSQLQTKLK